MKLRIFGEKEEKEVTLNLVKRGSDCRLAVCDKEGKGRSGGYLLIINSNGTIERCNSVSRKFGFDLDDRGRIKLEDA